MRLDCPNCGARLLVSAAERAIQNAPGVDSRLQGGEYTCNECQSDLDVYYF